MSWLDGPIAAFAAETTLGPLDGRRITSAALLILDTGTVTPRTWATGAPEHDGQVACSITSSLTAMVSAAVPVVISGAAAALTVLDRQTARHGGDTLSVIFAEEPDYPMVIIDPGVLHRHTTATSRTLSLAELASAHNLAAHTPGDTPAAALLAARVTWHLARAHPWIAAFALTDLHRRQARWATQQLRTRPPGRTPHQLWPVWLPAPHPTIARTD